MLLGTILTGCAATRPAEVETVLRISPSFPAARPPLSTQALSVEPVQAYGAVAERRYVYVDRDSPAQLRQAATLFWDQPPPQVVERALVSGLRGRFAQVAAPGEMARADERILVRLDRFEEVTGAGQPATAVVAFDSTAIDVGDRKLGQAGRYCAAVPIAGADPSARADAFAAAINQDVGQLAQDLAAGAVASTPSC